MHGADTKQTTQSTQKFCEIQGHGREQPCDKTFPLSMTPKIDFGRIVNTLSLSRAGGTIEPLL